MPLLRPWVSQLEFITHYIYPDSPLVIGPRARAPLGQKTTNAKARAFATPGNKLSVAPKAQFPATQSKPKHVMTNKLAIPADQSPLHDAVAEPEYAPPQTKDLPYESDCFPDGCLDYSVLRGKNLMRGWQHLHAGATVDAQGKTQWEREEEAAEKRSAAKAEELCRKAMEEPWTVGDVPETFRHLDARKKKEVAKVVKKAALAPLAQQKPAIKSFGASTLDARRAVSALVAPTVTKTVGTKLAAPKPKPFLSKKIEALPLRPAGQAVSSRHTTAIANSRSTIGYNKGRSASGILQTNVFAPPTTSDAHVKGKKGGNADLKPAKRVLQRSISTNSTDSNVTVTPERWAEEQVQKTIAEEEAASRLRWLSMFDRDDGVEDNMFGGDGGRIEEEIRAALEQDIDEEEFVLKLED